MMVQFFIACCLGIVSGYLSGLSLVRHGKTIRHSFFLSLARLFSTVLLGLVLLRWGAIPFILFVGSHIIAMWIVILTHNE